MKNLKSLILSKYFWLTAAVIFIFSRIATWLFPFDSDHWIFYYIGRQWAGGATLYIDMWDHKSPLIFGYNSFLHSVFGDNLVWHRLVFTIIAVFAALLFYKTAQTLTSDLKIKNGTIITRISTLLFIFLSNLSQFTNSGNNNENLGIVAVLATVYFYLLYRRDPKNNQGLLLACGAAAGVLVLLKANFAFFTLPIVVDLFYIHKKNAYKLISSFATFVLAPLIMALAWVWYFKEQNTLKDFFVAAFEFNSKYIKALGWDLNSPGIVIFLGILLMLIAFFTISIVLSFKGIKKPNKPLGYILPTMSISVGLFMILAGTFYSHYFLIALPYLCLIFASTLNDFNKIKHKKILMPVLVVILLVLYLVSLKQLINTFSGTVKQDADNQVAVAEYIKNHTAKNDKFFAYTYGATLYRLADRDSGTRFISASHPLIDYKYNFGYDFNAKAIIDMEYNENKYVVMSADKNDIYRTKNPVLMNYFNKNYAYETTVAGYDVYVRKNK